VRSGHGEIKTAFSRTSGMDMTRRENEEANVPTNQTFNTRPNTHRIADF
jgi:hypothetical protein